MAGDLRQGLRVRLRAIARCSAALLAFLALTAHAASALGSRLADAATALAATRTPYASQALGGPNGSEQSGLPDAGLDCMTFVEAALMRAAGVNTPLQQQQWLQRTRYDGKPASYCTRAHYLSDWLGRNAAQGWIEDITPALAAQAGLKLQSHVWSRKWMAQHGLDPSGCVAAGGTATPFPYVASRDYARIAPHIADGDVLAFVARAPGLDSAHVGIAVAGNGIAMASSLSGHTVLKPDWPAYASAQPQFAGLRVFRVQALPQASAP